MKTPSHQELIDFIKGHLSKTGEKPSSFGRRVLGDSGAITRLIEGTDPRLSTMQKIERAVTGSIKDNKNVSK